MLSRRTEGKVENSRGWLMYREVRRMSRATVKLQESRMSRRRVGRGMTMTIRMETTPIAMAISLRSILISPVGIKGLGIAFSAMFS